MHGREAHQRVHLGERQQRRGRAGAGAGGAQMGINLLQRPGRGEEAGPRIQRDLEAHCAQLGRRQVRGAPALPHVRQ